MSGNKRREHDPVDVAIRSGAAATGAVVERLRGIGPAAERGDEDEDDSDVARRVPGTEIQAVQKKDDKNNQDVDQILKQIPEEERARIKFHFKMRKPGMLRGGNAGKMHVGEFPAAGDDWQSKIKRDCAALRGPGHYEGEPKLIDGTPTKAQPWVFEVDEDFARESGWAPEGEEKKNQNQGAAAVLPQAPAAPVPPPPSPENDPVLAEKQRLELLKVKIETTKVEQELKNLMEKGKPSENEPSKKGAQAESPELVEKLLAAEKARIEAETSAKLAKEKAEREAEIQKIKADHEREMARVKAESEAAQRRSDAAMNDLKIDLARSKEDLDRKFEKFMEQQQRAKPPEPKAEKTDYTALAITLRETLAPLAAGLQPLASVLVEKLATPAAPPPDPTKFFEAAAKVFANKNEAPQQPQIDPVKLVDKTLDMVMAKMPQFQPKESEAPKQDTMELLEKTFALVKSAQPAPPPPAPVAPPPPPAQPAPDPMEFTEKVLGMARQLAELSAPRHVERDDEDDEDDDRLPPHQAPPADPLDVVLEAKEKLNKLGVNVQIGNGAPPEAKPERNMVKDVFDGLKDALPATVEAYMRMKAESQKKEIEEQREKLRRNVAAKKQREAARRVVEARRNAAANAARHRAAQHPGQAYQQPQPQPPQPQAQQPRAQQPQAPHQPQAPRPAQARRPAAPPRPQQPQPGQNRFLPPQQQQQQQQQQPPQQQQQQQPAPGAYNLPTVTIQPPAPVQHLTPVPTETIPVRQQAKSPPPPVEHIPRVALTPQQVAAARQAAAQRMAAQRPQQAQQRPAQAQAQQPQARPAQARPAQQARPVQAQQPVAQKPQPQPQPQTPKPTQAPAPAAAHASAPAGTTAEEWGKLCDYVTKSMERQDDPEAVALHLMDNHSTAIGLIVAACGSNVTMLETGLTSMAGQVGAYGTVVNDLASKIRTDPGKTWASQLLAALNGGK